MKSHTTSDANYGIPDFSYYACNRYKIAQTFQNNKINYSFLTQD